MIGFVLQWFFAGLFFIAGVLALLALVDVFEERIDAAVARAKACFSRKESEG